PAKPAPTITASKSRTGSVSVRFACTCGWVIDRVPSRGSQTYTCSSGFPLAATLHPLLFVPKFPQASLALEPRVGRHIGRDGRPTVRRLWIILALCLWGCANAGVEPAALDSQVQTGSIVPPGETARGELRKVQ